MKLKKHIETTEDLIAWGKRLERKTKKELVEFILSKAIGDPKFTRTAYYRLFPELMSTEEYLSGYLSYMEDERKEKDPSLDDMVYFTEDLLEKAEGEKSLLLQVKVYTAIIKELNDALEEGIERDQKQEDLVITLMDECLTFMEEVMEEKTGDRSVEEILEVRDHLISMQRKYKPVDGENRIDEALQILTDLTIERTKINEKGAYIRGAGYYAGVDEKTLQDDAEERANRIKEKARKKEVSDYIIALCNLYGMVHKKKVVDIYNMQHAEKITLKEVESIQEKLPKEIDEAWIDVHQGYFVSSSILEHREFLYYIREKGSKPYYIPEKEELLKYLEGFYFEKTKEYHQFVHELKKNYKVNQEKAEDLVSDVVALCQFNYSTQGVISRLEEMGLVFSGEKDLNNVVKLIMNLMNNTRIWENNGYTPEELFHMEEKNKLKPIPLLSTAYMNSDKKTDKRK
ncbi:hypothetical protein [Proteiniclasticum ruminis]|uniref:hypothetical protein n=1 Tax=Proteiniclasticum ruminis TaxID=398199 RepID=UPI0028A956CB|nr:hypothetical protein [Proteiniclasticum ruminis]